MHITSIKKHKKRYQAANPLALALVRMIKAALSTVEITVKQYLKVHVGQNGVNKSRAQLKTGHNFQMLFTHYHYISDMTSCLHIDMMWV
jgi:hypothetical protein